MSDEKLCAEVARIWVDGGGDVEGIDWCRHKIKQAVKDELISRERHPEPLAQAID